MRNQPRKRERLPETPAADAYCVGGIGYMKTSAADLGGERVINDAR